MHNELIVRILKKEEWNRITRGVRICQLQQSMVELRDRIGREVLEEGPRLNYIVSPQHGYANEQREYRDLAAKREELEAMEG